MTKLDFTPAHPLDVAAIELEARRLRAEFIRASFAAFVARVSTLLRGSPAPQA